MRRLESVHRHEHGSMLEVRVAGCTRSLQGPTHGDQCFDAGTLDTTSIGENRIGRSSGTSRRVRQPPRARGLIDASDPIPQVSHHLEPSTVSSVIGQLPRSGVRPHQPAAPGEEPGLRSVPFAEIDETSELPVDE
jgi:hypothetical protein